MHLIRERSFCGRYLGVKKTSQSPHSVAEFDGHRQRVGDKRLSLWYVLPGSFLNMRAFVPAGFSVLRGEKAGTIERETGRLHLLKKLSGD